MLLTYSYFSFPFDSSLKCYWFIKMVKTSVVMRMHENLCMFGCIWLFATPCTIAYQALLSMGFSRQEYWGGLQFLFQSILPSQGLNQCLLHFLHWQVYSLPLYHLGSPKFQKHATILKVCISLVIVVICHVVAKSLQSCPTLCDPIDGSPPGSPIPGILQARTLEWVAISFSMHESEKWKWSRSVLSDA